MEPVIIQMITDGLETQYLQFILGQLEKNISDTLDKVQLLHEIIDDSTKLADYKSIICFLTYIKRIIKKFGRHQQQELTVSTCV